MTAELIWTIGSSIFIVLGSIHLVYTFFTDKFLSKNEQVIAEMKSSSPILSKETTMWKAWVGFNASHSIGAIFFGVMNIYLIQNFFSAVQSDYFFFSFNILIVGFYLWLAKRYWFSIPFWGIFLTLVCFITSLVMVL